MYYDIIATYYDGAYRAKTDLNDLDFYLGLAKESQGKVLEIGCGTGRVLLEIARAGIPVDGIDFALPMLEVLKDKLASEDRQVQDLVTHSEADMRDFDLGQKYDLVIIPFRVMQHMYTIEDQMRALICARNHLKKEGGRLAFNVFYPNFTMIESDIGLERFELEWTDLQDPRRTIQRSFVRTQVNKLHQYFEGEFIFRTFENGEQVHEERAPLKMSYYTYPHLEALFKMSGLQILEQYGSFEKEPIDRCEEMIFVLAVADG